MQNTTSILTTVALVACAVGAGPTTSARAACERRSHHLDVTGAANGFIDLGTSSCDDGSGQVWYEGFSVSGDGGGPWSGVDLIMPFAIHTSPIQFLPPAIGQTWSDDGYSNGYPVYAFSQVISLGETVVGPAGTFSQCALVDVTLSYPSGYTPGQSYPVSVMRWLAPGVGAVRVVIRDNNEIEHVGELLSYQTAGADPDDYFPLTLGFSWTAVMLPDRTATWTVTESVLLSGAIPDGVYGTEPPLTLSKNEAGQITLNWSPSCSMADDDYEIYEGSSPTTYSIRYCSTDGVTTSTFTPSENSAYYLVVPTNGEREGSYGRDSAGDERPPAVDACLPQAFRGC